MSQEIKSVETSIQARDDTIMALGEKLANAREKTSKPFFVVGKGLGDDTDMPGLYRKGESKKWTSSQQANLQNDMLREMARLSLVPMGLSEDQMVEMQEELATTMKFERIERERQSMMADKAMDLIRAGEAQNVPRSKTRAFLQKKHLSEDLIEECFHQFDLNESRSESERSDSESSIVMPTLSPTLAKTSSCQGN